MNKLKLIYLEWEDAMSRSSWIHDAEIDDWSRTGWLIKQVGWVIRENERYMILASQWNPETYEDDNSFGNIQKIPKTWIRKRRIIKL